MKSLVLSTATRFLLPLMLLFSFFSLLRGHNAPGGGFIGGLIAAAAVSLYMISYDVEAARRLMVVPPHSVVGAGLLVALTAGISAWSTNQPFLTAQWYTFKVAGRTVEIGTPLVFDAGVYMVVLGVTVMIVFALAEE